VIIPAHDEAAVIGRLLTALAPSTTSGDSELDVIVVCNGCTDDTVGIARGFTGVRVIESADASKAAALRLGDQTAQGFPRIYLDADVEIDRAGLVLLGQALAGPTWLAVSARRSISRAGVSPWVRWYYDVWEELPGVRTGLFGRGVIGLSRQGHLRIAGLPALMADDLAMSSSFTAAERQIVDAAVVTVHPPRTWSDLIRRRVRAATGTAQAYSGDVELVTDSRTTPSDLVGICRRRPALLLRLPVFLLGTLIARRRATGALARGDFDTWLRDESSRATGPSG
jgi:glycosyltransferase involved in cell wall biosynthesis